MICSEASGPSGGEGGGCGRGGPVSRRPDNRRGAQRRGPAGARADRPARHWPGRSTAAGAPRRPRARHRVASRLFDDRSHSRPAYSRRASTENPSPHVVVHSTNPTVFVAQTMAGFGLAVKSAQHGVGKQVFSDRPCETIHKEHRRCRRGRIRPLGRSHDCGPMSRWLMAGHEPPSTSETSGSTTSYGGMCVLRVMVPQERALRRCRRRTRGV